LTTLKSLRAEVLTADMGVNFANGFLTPDLELLPHDPEHGMAYVLPYRYLPEEHLPTMFLEHLEHCWGDDPDYVEKVQALREAIATTVFGMASERQRAICLYGVPHSGKSVIVETLLGLVPSDASSSVPPHDWSDTFLPTQMLRKLVNFCGELSDTQLIAGDRFKTIVEGGTINGQFKGGQIFQFKTTCAQWFATNHLPRSRDGSGGFTRRWLILRFNKAWPAEQKRVHLAKEILAQEREAIVAWALPSIRDLKDYTLPASHFTALGEMANLNNSIRHFLTSSEVEWGADGAWEETLVYNAYYYFCRRAGSQPQQLSRFHGAMLELQHELLFKAEKTPQGCTLYRGFGPMNLLRKR
jgi:P4 family phage/plasmid primase-like protien